MADIIENQDAEAPRDMANFLRRALFNHKGLNSKNVVVQVNGRKVFLEGTVTEAHEKEAIDRFIREFAFVESVSSYITTRKRG